jgi:transcription antitermination factor NusA-like protein
MVNTALDAFCVKSGILCRRCEEKVEKGQITELDLKIIRILTELEKRFPVIKDVFFHRAKETGNTLAILVNKRDMAKILSYGGKIIRVLGDKTGKRIKILGYGSDQRELLEELFSPFSILTINTIWLPDGTTETKVILQGRKPRRNPIDFHMVQQLAKEIGGLTLRIEFERS